MPAPKKQFDSKQYLMTLAQNTNCTLREDSSVEDKVRQNLFEEYSKQRDGIHCTDLTLCMRKSLFQKLYPSLPSTRQIGFFLDGSRRHQALQALYGENAVTEKEIEFEGIKCTIDILDDGTPIEFKSTRARNAISDHYVRQLVFYMLAVNSNKGILQIQRVMMPRKKKKDPAPAKEENPFPAYIIELNEEQRAKWLAEFRAKSEYFFNALQSKDPARVPIYRGDGNWLCAECAYKKQCDAIESGAVRE